MKTYQIFPITTGSMETENKLEATYLCYLIKGDDKVILVDNGQSSNALSTINHKTFKILNNIDSETLLMEGLRRCGVEPDDIELLVNTHLHWDHCYNNILFPKARIYVQKSEVRFALAPAPLQSEFYEIYQDGRNTRYWEKCAVQYEQVDGDYNLCDGIDLVALPGHTPGFQGVLINTDGGHYLVAGDSMPFLANWENRTYGLPQPSSIYTDLIALYGSFEKMIAISNYILPGHDRRVLKHPLYPF
jgi:glyoxylase-like metal-dependent hydrolase (beta-lactamase superfamily II)